MELTVVINQILVLFIMIFVGYIITKKKLINDEINNGLSILLTEVTLPALVVNSIISVNLNQEIIYNVFIMSIITLVSYLFLIMFSTLLSSKLNTSPSRKTVFKFLLIFANVGYMGIPVINSLYHQIGIFYAIINNIVFNVLVWTYGVYVFISNKSTTDNFQWSKLLNNGLIAVIAGFFLLFTGIELGPFRGALESLGQMTFPLSMLIIGGALTDINPAAILKDKHIYYQIFLKLILIPFIGFVIIRQLPIPQIIGNIGVLLLAMPAGAIAVIFARKYKGDYKFASEGVFFTTLFSLLTIPFFIWLISVF